MKIRTRLAFVATVCVGSALSTGNDFAFAQWGPIAGAGNCPYLYQPVCAKSRKRALVTYANACAAGLDRARIVSDGACPDNCPQTYKPVCARDANGLRRTYANACAANKDNAQIVRNGRCLLPSRQS
jgi:hypothetical protein